MRLRGQDGELCTGVELLFVHPIALRRLQQGLQTQLVKAILAAQ